MAYLESVVQQAADRDNNTFRTIDSYLHNRRENIASRPAFVPIELDLDLPNHVFYHPTIVELSIHATDLIIIDNVSRIFLTNKLLSIGSSGYSFVQ